MSPFKVQNNNKKPQQVKWLWWMSSQETRQGLCRLPNFQQTGHRKCFAASCWLETTRLFFANRNDVRVYLRLERGSELWSQVVTETYINTRCEQDDRIMNMFLSTDILIKKDKSQRQIFIKNMKRSFQPSCRETFIQTLLSSDCLLLCKAQVCLL